MASSITVACFGVLCLILIQNQVYSKPVDDDNKGELPQGDQPASQSQTALAAKPDPKATTPNAALSDPTSSNPQHSKIEETTTVKEAVSQTTQSSTVAAAAAGDVTPSAQAAGEKDGKGGSAVIVANYALLLVGACLLMRL